MTTNALLLAITSGPVLVREMAPPPDVVTLLLNVMAFPPKTMPEAPVVVMAPLNVACPPMVVSASCWMEAAEIAAAEMS